MKLAFKSDEHHTSTYRCKHIVRKAEEGSAHLSDRETRSHKIPSLRMQSSSFWACESCLSSKMSSASLLGSHVANKRHRPTPHRKPSQHLFLEPEPRESICGASQSKQAGRGHSRVCCCRKMCSCWPSCSACLKRRRVGTGSSSPGGPASASTLAMLAECCRKTQQYVTASHHPQTQKGTEAGIGFRDRETVR